MYNGFIGKQVSLHSSQQLIPIASDSQLKHFSSLYKIWEGVIGTAISYGM